MPEHADTEALQDEVYRINRLFEQDIGSAGRLQTPAHFRTTMVRMRMVCEKASREYFHRCSVPVAIQEFPRLVA